ncbi:MAG: hypothetical protein QOF11_1935 [Chloroflexota bacterium]|nr:hypothetical protein [Chloroflexota bacterium]
MGGQRPGPPGRRLLGGLSPLIRNAVLHINNEQPLLADLYSVPQASDVAVLCTNLRQLNGQRPIFADHIDSVFLFPLVHLRFIEMAPEALAQSPDAERPAERAGLPALTTEPQPEVELEIDEEFLRRVRDV